MPSATRGSQKNSARQRFDDDNAHGDGGAAEAPLMGNSEDHGGSQTEISDHATGPLAIDGPYDDGDTGSDAEALPTGTSEDPLSGSRQTILHSFAFCITNFDMPVSAATRKSMLAEV